MFKNYAKAIIVTSVVTLLPLFFGLALWNVLPDMVPSHFNAAGEIDGWMQKVQFVFFMPGIMLGTHFFVILCMAFDGTNKKMSGKVIRLILWIIPATSLLVGAVSYPAALKIAVPVNTVFFIFSGILYMVLGNVMGKVRYSYTIGLRLPTTLNDENNWFHTHRVFSWTMTIAGLVIVATAFFGTWSVYIAVTAAAVGIPMVYSFVYAARHPKNGKD